MQKDYTKGVHYNSIFKAINNLQGTLCTYMVMKVMAPESQPFCKESCMRHHSQDLTTILKHAPPPRFARVCMCVKRRVSTLHKLALPLWAPSPISLTFR